MRLDILVGCAHLTGSLEASHVCPIKIRHMRARRHTRGHSSARGGERFALHAQLAMQEKCFEHQIVRADLIRSSLSR
jgi:hypothetical protein